MQVRTDSKNGATVASPSETVETFQAQTQSRIEQWTDRLQGDPDRFVDIEQEIDQHYRQGGGQLVASLLAKVTENPEMDEHLRQVRQDAAIPLRAPQSRTLKVRLLCGLVLWVTTAYCAPRRTKETDPSKQLGGLYPELAAFGIGKGCSPALQYKVARIVALSPSIEVAWKELKREGIVLDKKVVRRIAELLGHQLLELRRRELFAWREGWLPAGNDFAGRRVAVQIDGGRVRLRENKKRKRNSKKKKGSRQKFDTPWREPKALIIFEFNEQGKMVKKERQPLIDGTLLGPDNLAELVAFHLHRLGVAQAELVVFISDGARWIWDRLEWIERRAGLDSSQTMHVLDFCHAAHHISLALAVLGLTGNARRTLYGQLRKSLKKSRYDEVVSELKERAKRKKLIADHNVWTEIRYLENHGAAGHLRYATFRRRGIPCGSGAIESTIRRVINQRLKNNATYWLEENAEAMFAIRALILTDRWEETLGRVRQTMARDRRIHWQWTALDLTKLKADETVSPPSPQTLEKQQYSAIAA
jgi:hypothetical protein